VLGSALFLLYNNDLIEVVEHSSIRLFADDTLIYHSVASLDDIKALQSDLDKIHE
jgi:hypothetical protein